jgi:hypothetical protein
VKNKLLVISIALALVLALFIPATALADLWNPPIAKHLNLILTTNKIDDSDIGKVWPVRETSKTDVWPVLDMVSTGGAPKPTIVGWIVDGRSIYGDLGGDIKGTFTFTYGGVLDVLQAGSIQGIVTIQASSSPLDIIYMAARGDLETQVKETFIFNDIRTWCTGKGIPVGMFFAQIYNTPELAVLGDVTVKAMYEAGQLPPLPKTLTAVFTGMSKIEAGTGAYSGARGSCQFKPRGGKALILHVTPDQHVNRIEGQIEMTGTYLQQLQREIGKIDRDNLNIAIDKWLKEQGK